jgi:molecular chaperone DnaK
MFPSVVAFTKDGERLVGIPAKRQAVTNPERTVMRIKRKMGTDYKITIDDKMYTPQEISAMILQKIKADAEAYLGEEVKKAVITVPAYFNDNQRQATKDAGKIAGLEVLRIVNEPTAAALAFGLDKAEEQKLIVLDFGGGTFDVTIMEMGDGVFEVISTSGDTNLGGSDMDKKIMDHITNEIKEEHGIDLSKDRVAMQRIRDAAEKAKIELSSTVKTTINLPFIASVGSEPKHIEMTLTRAKLEELIEDVLKKIEGPIERAFKDAKLKHKDISKVILVGGPTRMPAVRKKFEKIIGKKAERGIDPMQCVAIGAAIQGAVISGEVKDIVLLDVTPLSLGIETLGGVDTQLIERNTTIPTRKSQIFTTAADNQTTVEINVLQGERPMAADNISLGRFHLTGIPPAPRGIPQIEVTFDIDANGIVDVSAKDLATNREQKITITATTNLSKEEVDQKVKDAEKYAEEDKKRSEKAEMRNKAETMIYTAESTLKEAGDKITAEQKDKMNDAIKRLKDTLKSDEIDKIKKEIDEFTKISHEIATSLYQQATQQAQKEGEKEKSKENKGEDYVDADFKEVDKEEKKE